MKALVACLSQCIVSGFIIDHARALHTRTGEACRRGLEHSALSGRRRSVKRKVNTIAETKR
jgi:hypothetical protein